MDKKEFTLEALDKNAKMFVVYITTLLAPFIMQVYPSYKAQVDSLLADKGIVKVLLKHLDYAEFFFFELVIKLLVNTNMNKNVIKLIEDKQPPYRPIFSLKPVELKILKTCIETYLKTRFI